MSEFVKKTALGDRFTEPIFHRLHRGTARKLMLEELFHKDENNNWLIRKIGITANYSAGYAKMVSDIEWREIHQQYNVMLDRHLRANFRFGYWELIFMHTKPLGVIPKDMRAR